MQYKLPKFLFLNISKFFFIFFLSILSTQLVALGTLSVPLYDFSIPLNTLEEEYEEQLALDGQLEDAIFAYKTKQKTEAPNEVLPNPLLPNSIPLLTVVSSATENNIKNEQDLSQQVLPPKEATPKLTPNINTNQPISVHDFLSRGKMAFLATIETVFKKKPDQALESDRKAFDQVEGYLLLAINVTAAILLCVLLTLCFRFFFRKKAASQTALQRSKHLHLKEPILNPIHAAGTQNVMSAEVLDSPLFFGIPNTEMGGMAKESRPNQEEDWEANAIRDFNQRFSKVSKEENHYPENIPNNRNYENTWNASSTEILTEILAESSSLQLGVLQTVSTASTVSEESNNSMGSINSMDSIHSLSMQSAMSLKLELAKTYLELDDKENAKLLLEEILLNGNEDEKQSASNLFAKL